MVHVHPAGFQWREARERGIQKKRGVNYDVFSVNIILLRISRYLDVMVEVWIIMVRMNQWGEYKLG